MSEISRVQDNKPNRRKLQQRTIAVVAAAASAAALASCTVKGGNGENLPPTPPSATATANTLDLSKVQLPQQLPRDVAAQKNNVLNIFSAPCDVAEYSMQNGSKICREFSPKKISSFSGVYLGNGQILAPGHAYIATDKVSPNFDPLCGDNYITDYSATGNKTGVLGFTRGSSGSMYAQYTPDTLKPDIAAITVDLTDVHLGVADTGTQASDNPIVDGEVYYAITWQQLDPNYKNNPAHYTTAISNSPWNTESIYPLVALGQSKQGQELFAAGLPGSKSFGDGIAATVVDEGASGGEISDSSGDIVGVINGSQGYLPSMQGPKIENLGNAQVVDATPVNFDYINALMSASTQTNSKQVTLTAR